MKGTMMIVIDETKLDSSRRQLIINWEGMRPIRGWISQQKTDVPGTNNGNWRARFVFWQKGGQESESMDVSGPYDALDWFLGGKNQTLAIEYAVIRAIIQVYGYKDFCERAEGHAEKLEIKWREDNPYRAVYSEKGEKSKVLKLEGTTTNALRIVQRA